MRRWPGHRQPPTARAAWARERWPHPELLEWRHGLLGTPRASEPVRGRGGRLHVRRGGLRKELLPGNLNGGPGLGKRFGSLPTFATDSLPRGRRPHSVKEPMHASVHPIDIPRGRFMQIRALVVVALFSLTAALPAQVRRPKSGTATSIGGSASPIPTLGDPEIPAAARMLARGAGEMVHRSLFAAQLDGGANGGRRR